VDVAEGVTDQEQDVVLEDEGAGEVGGALDRLRHG
jgi:hypothetical protein